MHPLIEGIIRSSEARRPIDRRGFKPLKDPRDLIGSAGRSRAKGLVPVVAEIKPRILGRPLRQGEAASYARRYEELGACAVSVLTEPSYFLGSIEILPEARGSVDIPVLRKDFIVEEEQLDEEAADLVLLIAGLCPDLQGMVDEARSRGMEPLVEVHTDGELELALKTDARIAGINNRDLRTLEVDLGTFERLAPKAKDAGVFLVAESGIHTREDAMRMVHAGADALLVGTALMREPERLREINKGMNKG
jgi:indole-3-glycerol phosphate synthase